MPWDIIASAVAPALVGAVFGGDSGGGGGGSSQSRQQSGGGGLLGQAVGGAVSHYLSPADATKAAAAADPLGPERAQYATKLSSMMNGGFTPDDPSYKWRMEQGTEAVNRGTAASGGLNSGGRLTALESFGQGLASTEFQAQFGRLSELSGARTGSPGAAGQILAQQNSQNQQSASTFGNAVGGIVNGIGKAIYDNWGNIVGYDSSGSGDGGNGNGGYTQDGVSYNNPSAYTDNSGLDNNWLSNWSDSGGSF